MGLAASLQMCKSYDEAIETYGVAAMLDDNDPHAHYHAAECYFLAGDPEKGKIALGAAEAVAARENKKNPNFISQLAIMRQVWCNEVAVEGGS